MTATERPVTSPGRTRIRRLLAAVVTIGAVLGVLTAPSAADASPAQTLRWGACPPIHGAGPDVRCATVRVPRDYADPTGPSIDILVSRLPARDPGRRRGVLIGNPGGPGGDAIAMFSALPLPDAMRDEWDLVAVQPRGLLSSTPVECAPVQESDTLAAITAAGALNRERCDKSRPGYVRTITTENTARDIEWVRRLLGVDKVSLYGISYGTLLMSTYATLFPRHTDRLVLDSGVDPSWIWNDVLASQTDGYKRRVHEMMAWIAQHDNIYHLGTTPLAVYRAWSAKVTEESGVPPSLAAPPAQVADVPPGLRAVAQQYIAGANLTAEARAGVENLIATLLVPGGNQATSSLLGLTRLAAPDRNAWPLVAMRTNGRATPPAKISPQLIKILTNLQQMQNLIMCNENQVPAQPAQIPAAVYADFVVGDVFDAPGLYYASGLACAGAPPVVRPVTLSNRGLAVQPLQIQSLGDPQTPYRGGLAMQRVMRSRLITVGGGDHAQLGRHNAPLDRAIVEYLRTGRTAVRSVPQAPITASLTTPPPRTGIGLGR
ncbi:alpha/beta fold hydrolase [Gordonia rhizosphera NBRC 16068]|uniref:alpha/beta fold hydrolase n=1 Tax=Gordonia rhizosphera TaxID=83341 RepID=UPI00068BAACF